MPYHDSAYNQATLDAHPGKNPHHVEGRGYVWVIFRSAITTVTGEVRDLIGVRDQSRWMPHVGNREATRHERQLARRLARANP
ncbi:hypothetical protein [Microvirga brassicacearum]|uniref:Uncharacterized protein n=1 Tax=Microvirga brassicacearum TaxID=2580413 RepID=A0A5N3PH32_9HYPH|nr:hypothetical protein [Microvirga brassicacearum]KAB0269019.1 hypothetical protein FEZ63_02615 [Microvirga brassicacearum]